MVGIKASHTKFIHRSQMNKYGNSTTSTAQLGEWKICVFSYVESIFTEKITLLRQIFIFAWNENFNIFCKLSKRYDVGHTIKIFDYISFPFSSLKNYQRNHSFIYAYFIHVLITSIQSNKVLWRATLKLLCVLKRCLNIFFSISFHSFRQRWYGKTNRPGSTWRDKISSKSTAGTAATNTT